MKWFDRDVEIRYGDTDQMGVVHHAVYALYCEMGRTYVCKTLGLPYEEIERLGYLLVVAELYCRYKAPARYGESIYVRSALTRLSRRVMTFEYEIRRRANDELLFTGNSKHVVTDQRKKPVSLPDNLVKTLKAGVG